MIDHESPIPLYHQVTLHLKRLIETKQYAPGDALPTEEELQRIYGVSRATVRQAVRQLVSAGLVRLAISSTHPAMRNITIRISR